GGDLLAEFVVVAGAVASYGEAEGECAEFGEVDGDRFGDVVAEADAFDGVLEFFAPPLVAAVCAECGDECAPMVVDGGVAGRRVRGVEVAPLLDDRVAFD